jgi:hypothetical protein
LRGTVRSAFAKEEEESHGLVFLGLNVTYTQAQLPGCSDIDGSAESGRVETVTSCTTLQAVSSISYDSNNRSVHLLILAPRGGNNSSELGGKVYWNVVNLVDMIFC